MRLTKRELQPRKAPSLEIKKGHCLEYLESIQFHDKFKELYIDCIVPKIYKALLLDTELVYRVVSYGEGDGVLSLIAVYEDHSLAITIAIDKKDGDEQSNGIPSKIVEKFLNRPNTHISMKSLVNSLIGEFVFSEKDMIASEESDGSVYLIIPINQSYELQLHLNNAVVQLDETIREADSSDRGA